MVISCSGSKFVAVLKSKEDVEVLRFCLIFKIQFKLDKEHDNAEARKALRNRERERE